VSTYESKIAEFRERIVSIGKQLADLAARRKSYSLAAASGDAKAIQEIADIDFALDAARKEEGTLSSAIETAAALDRAAEQDAEAKARHERNIAAHTTARAIIALNEELDLKLKGLREVFERRAALLVELGNSEACDRGLVMRLSHRSGPTAAAHQCGLGKYLNLEMVPNAAQRPLADTNEVLLGVGEPPPGAEPNDGKPKVIPRVNTRH
jgi:hypothetical protein